MYEARIQFLLLLLLFKNRGSVLSLHVQIFIQQNILEAMKFL